MKDGSLWGLGRNSRSTPETGTTVIDRNYSRVRFWMAESPPSGGSGTFTRLFQSLTAQHGPSVHNERGQLGIGDATENSLAPIKVIEGGVQVVDAGLYNSYSLKEDGNFGEWVRNAMANWEC